MNPTTPPNDSLAAVFDGWLAYRQSIINAVAPLTAEQLQWRPAAHLRSVGELVRHIALGSIEWFARMGAPGSQELAAQIDTWQTDGDGNRYAVESSLAIANQADELARWLAASSAMIAATLQAWTVADLHKSYRYTWNGNVYAIPRQWTIWRILAHDLHHGGELVGMLGTQGISNFELGDLGGHTILPPLADLE